MVDATGDNKINPIILSLTMIKQCNCITGMGAKTRHLISVREGN